MRKETDVWPFVAAKWFGPVPHEAPRTVRVIIWHDMEFPETLTAAEDVARYFQNPLDEQHRAVHASAHVCIDADSIVQCVHDRDIAYAAPPRNTDGIQLELAGYGRQTRDEWLDDYGKRLLGNACNVAAQYCAKFGIPPIRLTNAELLAGRRGMVGHAQVSEVYRKSTHTDPGPNFPWDYVLARVGPLYLTRMNVIDGS